MSNNIEPGKIIGMKTKEFTYITGILTVHGYALNEDGEPDEFYNVLLSDRRQLQLWGSELEDVWVFDLHTQYDYLVGVIGEKYGVDFTNEDDELHENGVILAKVKTIWNELDKDEQLEVIRVMGLLPEDIADLMNIIINQEKQLNKYHEWKIGVLDKAQEFMDLKKKSDAENPVLKPVCDLWYKELGVDKLISQIASR